MLLNDTIYFSGLVVIVGIVFTILWALGVFSSNTCDKKYTIKAGDTCYNIANANGLSVDNLKTLNSGINCDNLQPGKVLCVCDKTLCQS